MRLFLTGERFTGARAVTFGLAHRAVPGAQLNAAVGRRDRHDQSRRPRGRRGSAKRLVRRVPQLSTAEGFAETAPWSARVFRCREAVEGMAAFREKRKPSWAVGAN